MDVPFFSSSAINREHYNLVQGVEAAPTLQQVDDILAHKVDVVRRRFEKRAPSSSECVSSLILLLYCWTATSLGRITRESLEFALPRAITLAEAGRTLKEKRIGYLFCTEVMATSDELQLMLVNTIRKDLEDLTPARICLALDVLLLNCPIEAAPAVTQRLIDLLSHNSPDVKTKAMIVLQNISRHEPHVLITVHEKVVLRLKDPDLYVVGVALRILSELSRAHVIEASEAVGLILTNLTSLQDGAYHTRQLRLQFVQTIRNLISDLLKTDPTPDTMTIVVDALLQLIQDTPDSAHAIILEWFRTISKVPTENLRRHFDSKDSKPISLLGRLINSHEPNIQFLCVSCLLEFDAVLWAGIGRNTLSAFDESQVHTIMLWLDSSDRMIRIKTLRVLNGVDRDILLVHLTQLIAAFATSASTVKYRLAERTLEAAAVYELEGGAYANRLQEVCTQVSARNEMKGKQKTTDSGVRQVLEDVVEQVLLHLRGSQDKFRGEFVDATVRVPVSDSGPTLTVVIAAAVCEYGELSTISQLDVLRGLAARLEANPPAIQEALLLSMLRVTARCGSAFTEVSDQVRKLRAVSHSHIRRRCDQYLSFSTKIASLDKIIKRAKSDTLPDFLFALENTGVPRPQDLPPARTKSLSTSTECEKSRSSGKLRYEAYETPPPVPKHIHRRGSTTSVDSLATGSHSSRSDFVSSSPSSRTRRHSRNDSETGADGDADDDLARTLTAGDLALAAHSVGFPKPNLIDTSIAGPQAQNIFSPPLEDLLSKADLIALDSPFITEPSPLQTEKHTLVRFEMMWDALKAHATSRGWSECSAKVLEQRIKATAIYQIISIPPDVDPYQGELKMGLTSPGNIGTMRETGLLAAIRIRPEEQGSALWQMRCLNSAVKSELKKLLDDG